jgi:hypothetical protein
MAQARRADEGEEGHRSATQRPEYTAKVDNVEIAVWRNQGERGEFFTASAPKIRYQEKDGGEWKDGSSYGSRDLLSLAEAAREASAKIRELSKGRQQTR